MRVNDPAAAAAGPCWTEGRATAEPDDGSGADELPDRPVRRTALEAENQPNSQGVGQSLKRLDARLVAAALDAGDRRVAGTHALSQLLLGDPESGAMPDDQPGKFLELNKTLLLAPGPLVSKLAEAGANRAKRRSVRWSVPSWEPKGGCG